MNLAITTTAVLTVGLAEVDRIVHGKAPTMRPVIGGFIIGIGLFGLYELDQRLGTLFAVLIVLNAFLTHGLSVFGKINGDTPSKKGMKA